MKYKDLEELNDPTILRHPLEKFSEFDGKCVVDGMIPLIVDGVIGSYDSSEDIEIYNEDEELIGYLCICITSDTIDSSEISDYRYVAYINEVDKESLLTSAIYKFRKDYLILKLNHYENYKSKYLNSASIWGGFFHETNEVALKQPYRANPKRLTAIPELALPTSFHTENALRSVIQPYAFERFLKLYHLLELLFDFQIVTEIKALGDDLQGIGHLLSRYSSSELMRLKYILSLKCKDINPIAKCLTTLEWQDYLKTGERIFFEFGKDGNPFTGDKKQQFFNMINQGGFTIENAASFGFIPKDKKQDLPGKYKNLIIDTTAYWIYRVRSCIAHNRIGEYVMTNEDEEFIVEFAEPLLREVLGQSFKY